MPKTVARLKQGDLLLAGEVIERLPPIQNGIYSHFPMDGEIKDVLTTRKIQSYKATNRDYYDANFPQQYNYAGKKVRLSGWVKCNAAADGTKTVGIGFNYLKGDATNQWPCPIRLKFDDIKDWTYFNIEYTIPADYVKNLRPFLQLDIVFGTAGYDVDFKDVLYVFDFESMLITNNGATPTYDGVALEYATSNWQKIVTKDGAPITHGQNAFGTYFIRGDATTNWYNGIRLPTTNVTANQVYTWSFEVYSDVSFAVRWDPNCTTDNYTGNDLGHTVAYQSTKYDTPGQWQKMWVTSTPKADAVNPRLHHSFCPSDTAMVGHKVYYRNAQLETKAYPSEYAETSRDKAGLIEIPMDVVSSGSAFTLNYCIAPNGQSGSNSASRIELNNFGWIWLYNALSSTDQRNYIWDYKVTDSTRRFVDLASPTPFEIGKFEMITIVWDLSKVTFYRNGEYWTETPKAANCVIGTIDKLILKEVHAKLRDISFYKRALNATEIKKLAKRTLSIQKNGDIETIVSERPTGLPNSAFHIPLSSDTESSYHNLTPKLESDVTYDSGRAWLGKPMTNLVPTTFSYGETIRSGVWGGITLANDYIAYPNPINAPQVAHSVMSYSGTGGGGAEFGRSGGDANLIVKPNTTYTWTYYLKVRNDYWSDNFMYLRQYKSDGVTQVSEQGIARKVNCVDCGDGWYRLWATFTTGAEVTIIRAQHYLYDYNTAGNEFWFCGGQIEEGNYFTPYSPSRSYSRLTYEMRDIVPTGWNVFSAIFFVTMPEIVSGKYNLIGAWNTWYLGISSTNKVIFSWQDKQGGATLSQRSIQGVTNVPANKKVMISCVVGSAVEIYLNGVKDNQHTGTFSLDGSGTDLSINGLNATDNSYSMNGYVQDVIIVPGILTEDQMGTIYKTFMRGYKDNTNVQGKIIEGQVL